MINSNEEENRAAELQLQQEAMRSALGSWKDENHPELANGTDQWVRYLRSLGQERIDRIDALRLDIEAQASSAALHHREP